MSEVTNRIISLARYRANPENYNEHSDQQISDLRRSVRLFGQVRSVVVLDDGQGGFVGVAGHGFIEAAQAEGKTEVKADVIPPDWTPERVVAYMAADNETARGSSPDLARLAALVARLKETDEELAAVAAGGDARLKELLRSLKAPAGEDDGGQVDRAAELQAKWQVQPGDLWALGEHRLVCGDCTDASVVARVMGGERAALVHADPPYGMGKESEGVANDNLYREKLDAFQMAWWRACRPFVEDNGSAYIWGNAEDLWRLWYVGGLKDSERLTFRNEILWSKGGGGYGVGTESQRCYFPEERCLFFMLGEQGFNNNADNYWGGWDGIVEYLEKSRQAAGWSIKDTKRIAGHSEQSGCHWFDKSQWSMPTEETYKRWQAAARGDAFKREYDDLKREYDDLKREFYATRAYFDNSHDAMTDMWEFQRVTGEDRHGHATPKPVKMMERAIKSSAPEGAIVYVPFNGTGPEIIACEKTGRRARCIEIEPSYCAVCLERFFALTGVAPVLLEAGPAQA